MKSLLLTWESQVGHDGIFSFLCVAHKGQINIQHEEGHADQEGDHPDTNSIAARRITVVENALPLRFVHSVDVAFSSDGSKHHDGKHLK